MRSKSHQGKYSLLVLFVGIFAFWWGIAVLSQGGRAPNIVAQTTIAPATNTYTPQNVAGPVTIQESIKNDVYTYSGSIPLPSPCDQLGTGISVNGSNPQHVTIMLTLRKPLTDCADASDGSSEQPFAVSLSLKPGIKALLDGLTVNGVIVGTSLKEVAVK